MRELVMRLWRYFWRREFVLFGVIGVSEIIVGLLLLYVLIDQLYFERDTTYALVKVAIFEAAFILNYRLAWRRSGTFWPDWWKFHAAKAGLLALDWLSYCLLGLLGIPNITSALIVIPPIVTLSFLINDQKVFVSARRAPS